MLDTSKNYFELFGLPVAYIVDTDAVMSRYRDLQRVLHPDRFANASDQEKRLSVQQASLVNDALDTLKDPVRRARYLLRLHGVDFDTQTETTHDVAFLMEQMALREAIEKAPSAEDPFAAIDALAIDIQQKIQTVLAQIAMHFETPDEKNLEEARELIRKMQFLQKLHRDAEAIEEKIEDSI
jgi:molecular chaperone HscB